MTQLTEIDEYVQGKVASGEFATPEEFTLEAIRVYRELEARHTEFRDEVQRRLQQADRGDFAELDIDAIKAELVAEFDEQGQPR